MDWSNFSGEWCPARSFRTQLRLPQSPPGISVGVSHHIPQLGGFQRFSQVTHAQTLRIASFQVGRSCGI